MQSPLKWLESLCSSPGANRQSMAVRELFHTNIVLRAVSFAARAHLGQSRKDKVTPYFAHPVRVMTVLATVFKVQDPEVLAVAVLHDTIEDTTTDYDDLARQFGERVAKFVVLLSKDKRLPEDDRERVYFAGLAKAPVEVQLCKLADTYDNLIDSEALPPPARRKAVLKARELLRLFRPGMVADWQHVLDGVEERIRQAADQ